MKMKAFLGILLLPVFAWGQPSYTTGVARQVDSLIQVSRSLTEAEDFDQALAINAMAEKLATEKLGLATAAYGSTCFNHGRVLHLQGNLPEAEKWYLEAIAIRGNVLGKEDPVYAATLHNLAIIYTTQAEYDRALPLYLEARSIRGKALGKEDPNYIATIRNLGVLYYSMGKYDEASSCYLEAKTILEKQAGKEDPDYLECLNSLAVIYFDKGEYDKSFALNSEIMTVREKVLGKKHPDYGGSLSNLANDYSIQGNFAKALSLRLEAQSIFEEALGKETYFYTLNLGNLANDYYALGEPAKSLRLLLEAKTIEEKIDGKKSVDYAKALQGLVNFYLKQGAYDEALPFAVEVRSILEDAYGKEHPAYAENLNNLALIYGGKGDQSRATSYSLSSNAISRVVLQKSAAYYSEKEMLQYEALFEGRFSTLLHFTQIYGSDSLAMAAYDNALFLKHATLFRNLSLEKDIAQADSATRAIYVGWKSCHAQLARQYALTVVERDSARIGSLEERANEFEKELLQRSKNFVTPQREAYWQQVQQNLKPSEAAIEFVRYKVEDANPADTTMYAALLLHPGNIRPQFIPLFEEKDLQPLLRGTSGGSNFLKINALYAPKTAGNKQKSLYELIWQPLESQLQGITTIYCSPSGLLHRLNLAAIADNDGKIFGDLRQVILLGSTRQLVVPNARMQNVTNTAYLAGGIRYNGDSTAVAYANRSTSSRSIELPNAPVFQPDSLSSTRGGVLDYLPATATEVREIGQLLKAANVTAKIDTGFYATEEAFRHLGVGAPSPRVIHLATHGYFFPDPKDKTNNNLGQGPVFKTSDHPMIRSGLVLAGAKQAWLTGQHPQGQEDGILTAYEISQMNLSHTELVVLSACETGLGDIEGNEGVFGLQRAFKIAGAKYLIMSLWKVDDRSTRDFMTAFYRQWLAQKLPIPQAFRAAQQEMRVKHPSAYDWAGFVLIQ